MQLDATAAVLRPRNRWEAIDLGFVMIRRWFWPVYRVWLLVVVPLFVLLNLLSWRYLWVAPLLLWWLKPLLDRIPLFVLSRALFGDVPDTWRTLKALPGQLRPQALHALFWLRADPARSFHLPIIQLEGLAGKARRQRRGLLNPPGGSGGGWLTLVCLNFEGVVYFSLFALIALLFPEFMQFDFKFWLQNQHQDWLIQLGFNFASLIALTVVEPFYVAAGFALYLNRRTQLEAWDIEIGFRRLRARLQQNKHTIGAAAVLFLIVCSAPPVVQADNILGNSSCDRLFARDERLKNAPGRIKRTLAEVLAEKDFAYCEKTTRWRLKDSAENKPARTRSAGEKLGLTLAGAIEWLLWGLLIVCALLLLFWLLKQTKAPALKARRQAQPPAPLLVHGQEISAETFAKSAADEAWRLWQAGAKREALALLYRASLSALIALHHIDFGRSATEAECLGKAAQQLPAGELLDYLQRMTRIWQQAAYAHRVPAPGDVETLCRQWSVLFSSGSDHA